MGDRLLRVEGRVRTQNHVREGAQQRHIAVRNHVADTIVVIKTVLLLEHIESRAADFAALERLHQSVSINQLAAGGVDNQHAILHPGERLAVQQMIVLLRRVGVQGDHIRAGKQLLQRNIIRVFFRLRIPVGIVAEDFAAKARQMLNDSGADMAGTDDPHRLKADVRTDFAAQRVVLESGTVEDGDGASLQHEHQHDGIIGDAGRRIADI